MKPLHRSVHGGLCVLSIDDDEVNLMVMAQFLQPLGCKVISAVDWNEAEQNIQTEDTWPDIVFLDYTLQEERGDQVKRGALTC